MKNTVGVSYCAITSYCMDTCIPPQMSVLCHNSLLYYLLFIIIFHLTVRFSNGTVKNVEKLDFTMYKNADERNPRKKSRRILVRKFPDCFSKTTIRQCCSAFSTFMSVFYFFLCLGC